MTKRLMITTAIALIGFSMLAANGHAELRSVPATLVAAEKERALIDMNELAEQGARLKANTEAALKSLDEKQSSLEATLKEVKGAREFAEELIRLLRETAARLAPDSSYMKTLQAQEEAVRELARQAITSNDPSGEVLNRQAQDIAAMRTEAQELAGQLSAQIDRVERFKSQIGFAYAARRTQEFVKTARSYLDTIKGVLKGTSEMATKAEEIIGPTVPTQ